MPSHIEQKSMHETNQHNTQDIICNFSQMSWIVFFPLHEALRLLVNSIDYDLIIDTTYNALWWAIKLESKNLLENISSHLTFSIWRKMTEYSSLVLTLFI